MANVPVVSPSPALSPTILNQIDKTVQEKAAQNASQSLLSVQTQSSFPKSELDDKILHPQPNAHFSQVHGAFFNKTFVLWTTSDGQYMLSVYPTIQLGGIFAVLVLLIVTGIGIRRVLHRKRKKLTLPQVKRLAL